MSTAEYTIEVVGGKHDGVRGMYWTDDGQHPPPDRIVVGTCRGEGECNAGNREWCRQAGAAVRKHNGGGVSPSEQRHPAFWTLDEGYAPPDGLKYRLTHIRPEEEGKRDAAVYVIAGVSRTDPNAVEEALTVEKILAAKPRWVPEPVTAAGRLSLLERLRIAQGFGLRLTSGVRPPEHPMCRGSYHVPDVAWPELPMGEVERQTFLPPGRHEKGWQ